MSLQSKASFAFRMLEGSAIALDSIRANKVRAALTILGVAIGVTVVIAMASACPFQHEFALALALLRRAMA